MFTLKRKIMLYAALLLLGWGMLMFVLIPWDDGGNLPPGSFALIEGQRAYAMIVRKERPTLGTVIRGLNTVGAEYRQEQDDNRRWLTSGNIRLFFDKNGEFLHLDILKNAREAAHQGG